MNIVAQIGHEPKDLSDRPVYHHRQRDRAHAQSVPR
jgi:hypothetical protein